MEFVLHRLVQIKRTASLNPHQVFRANIRLTLCYKPIN